MAGHLVGGRSLSLHALCTCRATTMGPETVTELLELKNPLL